MEGGNSLAAGPEGRKRRVSFFYDLDFKNKFRYGQDHPMKPRRLWLTKKLVKGYNLMPRMEMLRPFPASRSVLEEFHEADYVSFLKEVTPKTQRQHMKQLRRFNLGDECPVFDGLYRSCKLSAGGSVGGAYQLNHGRSDIAINWAGGFHHAKRCAASGFCYINDVVLAIFELLQCHQRVLYVDIDIHHGDGVEEAFQETNRVMTVSFHKFADNFFPGTGAAQDIGCKEGEYYSLNVPLDDGIDDESYQSLFKPIMTKVMEMFQPGAVVLQCGADSLSGDALGCFNLSVKGHAECVRFMRSYNVPLLILGGGGYTIPNVARCWCYETAVAVGEELDDKLPHHKYSDHFGPHFTLHFEPARDVTNKNSKRNLDNLRTRVLANLSKIPHVPSAQFSERPPATELPEKEDGDLELRDKGRAWDGEIYDSDFEDRGLRRRNQGVISSEAAFARRPLQPLGPGSRDFEEEAGEAKSLDDMEDEAGEVGVDATDAAGEEAGMDVDCGVVVEPEVEIRTNMEEPQAEQADTSVAAAPSTFVTSPATKGRRCSTRSLGNGIYEDTGVTGVVSFHVEKRLPNCSDRIWYGRIRTLKDAELAANAINFYRGTPRPFEKEISSLPRLACIGNCENSRTVYSEYFKSIAGEGFITQRIIYIEQVKSAIKSSLKAAATFENKTPTKMDVGKLPQAEQVDTSAVAAPAAVMTPPTRTGRAAKVAVLTQKRLTERVFVPGSEFIGVDPESAPMSESVLQSLLQQNRKRVHGLVNRGNMCYLNVIVHILRSLPSFVDGMEHLFDLIVSQNTVKGSGSESVPGIESVHAALRNVFRDLKRAERNEAVNPTLFKRELFPDLKQSDRCEPVDSTLLKRAIERHRPRLQGSEQQDAHELFGIIVDLVQEGISSALKKQYSMEADRPKLEAVCPATQNFSCSVRKNLTCVGCGNVSSVEEPNRCFSLAFPEDARTGTSEKCSLESLLDLYFQEDTVLSRKCENCGLVQDTKKKYQILKLPHVLVLQLKRVHMGPDGAFKVSASVAFTSRLDIGPWCAQDTLQKFWSPTSSSSADLSTCYKLHGVVNHLGQSAFGHYVTDIFDPEAGGWLNYDDSIVTDVSEESVLANVKEAYMLVYVHKSAVSKASD